MKTIARRLFGGAFAIRINDDDILVLSDDDKVGYGFVNCFEVDGSDLFFLSEGSSNFLYVKLTDGERFTGTFDEVYDIIM